MSKSKLYFPRRRNFLLLVGRSEPKIPGVHRIESLQVVKMVKYAYDWGQQAGAPV